MGKKDFDINEEQLADNLDHILKEIHTNEDPAELNQYRRIFKKNVSIFKRAYAAAYMLKYFKDSRRRGNPREPDNAMTSVFISIGRARRVYPKDIVGLIMDSTNLARQDIGNIKILDNYSFTDISPSKTDEVIQSLNGSEYRGRPLTVNYAKKKN